MIRSVSDIPAHSSPPIVMSGHAQDCDDVHTSRSHNPRRGRRSLIGIGSFDAMLGDAADWQQRWWSLRLRLAVLNPDIPRLGYVDPWLPYADGVDPAQSFWSVAHKRGNRSWCACRPFTFNAVSCSAASSGSAHRASGAAAARVSDLGLPSPALLATAWETGQRDSAPPRTCPVRSWLAAWFRRPSGS